MNRQVQYRASIWWLVRSLMVPASAESVYAASVRCSACATDPGRRPPHPRCRWEQVWTAAWPGWETRPQVIWNTTQFSHTGQKEERDSRDSTQSSCWPLATAELTQVLLPGGSQGHLELQALQDAAALERSQLGSGPWQQGGENGAKVLVYLQGSSSIMSSVHVVIETGEKSKLHVQKCHFIVRVWIQSSDKLRAVAQLGDKPGYFK